MVRLWLELGLGLTITPPSTLQRAFLVPAAERSNVRPHTQHIAIPWKPPHTQTQLASPCNTTTWPFCKWIERTAELWLHDVTLLERETIDRLSYCLWLLDLTLFPRERFVQLTSCASSQSSAASSSSQRHPSFESGRMARTKISLKV